MERHIFPQNGKTLSPGLKDRRCQIMINNTHPSFIPYNAFCRLQLIESQWFSLSTRTNEMNDAPLYVIFFVDLGWNQEMLTLREELLQSGMIVNICRFGELWEEENPIGNSFINSLEELTLNQ